MNTTAKITLAVIAVPTALAAAACGSATVTPASKTAPTTAQPSASSEQPQAQPARVGDRFTITGQDGTSYQVALAGAVQDAEPASEFGVPAAGHHLAAAKFRVTATTRVDENANNDATATGSDEQAYTAAMWPVAEGTNFAGGQIRLQPGGALTGWVSFELPDGVQIAKVQWTPSSGFGSQTAEWAVPATSGQPAGPAATVRAYFAAINAHDYARAWNLGGRNTGSSYPGFAGGFATTAHDTVTVLSVSGDVVTAQLTAQDTDGTIKTFQGTYTVRNGVIVAFDVQQTG